MAVIYQTSKARSGRSSISPTPAAPVSVTAVASAVDAITITWQDPADSAALQFYIIERSSGTGYTQVGTANPVSYPATQTFVSSNLSSGTYTFRVSCYSVGGVESAKTVSNSVTITAAPPEVVFGWKSFVTPGYSLGTYTSGTGGTYPLETLLDIPAGVDPTYTITTSSDSSISVNFDSGVLTVPASLAAGSYSVTVDAVGVVPLAPVTGLVATPSVTSVSLSWTAVSGATGYLVEHSLTGTGGWTQNSATATNYSVSGLTPSTRYYFRVSATNSGQTGTPSAVVSAQTRAAASSSDWEAMRVAPGVVWAHPLSSESEIAAALNPPRADKGNSAVYGQAPREIMPHILTAAEDGEEDCLEFRLLGATLAQPLAQPTLPSATYAISSPVMTIASGGQKLTFTAINSVGLRAGDSIYITAGNNVGLYAQVNAPSSSSTTTPVTMSISFCKWFAASIDTSLTFQYSVRTGDSNPYQTIVVDEDVDNYGQNWPLINPNYVPGSGVPSNHFVIKLHHEIGTQKWCDNVCVVSSTYDSVTKLTTLYARRNAGYLRVENDMVTMGFPAAFPVGTIAGMDVPGGWTRTLAPLVGTQNGLGVDDLNDPGVTVRNWTTPQPGSNYYTAYYGHPDYHGIWAPPNPPLPNNLYSVNAVSPYQGSEFYIYFKSKVSGGFATKPSSSKRWFLDCSKNSNQAQIVEVSPELNEPRFAWFHNYGSDRNSKLYKLNDAGNETLQPDSAWDGTCIVGNAGVGRCWETPLDTWYEQKLHVRAGHQNEFSYAGLAVTEFVSNTGPIPSDPYTETLVVRTAVPAKKAGMINPATGRYYRSDPLADAEGEGGNPLGLSPDDSTYFVNWKADFTTGYTSPQFKISGYSVSGGVATWTLTRRRPLDTWPTANPPVGAVFTVSWEDQYVSPKYRDTLLEMWKRESTDTDWVLVSRLWHPVTFSINGGAFGTGSSPNAPGWNNFQPTAYANVDDNNPPPSRTVSLRMCKVILSHEDIA